MDAYCPRCGARGLADPEICPQCVDGVADARRTAMLVRASEAGNDQAVRVLADVSDDRALGVLLIAAEHADPRVRRAALKALGAIGDRAAIPIAAASLEHEDRRVRQAAIGALAEIGPAAGDLLATRLDDPTDAIDVATALAWQHDPRAVRVLGPAVVEDPSRMAYHAENIFRSPIMALGWLGDGEARTYLLTAVDAVSSGTLAWKDQMAASQLVAALETGGGAVDPAIMRRLEDQVGRLYPLITAMPVRTADAPAPHPDRLIPRWSFSLQPTDMPTADRVTKFGGQPVWTTEPTWPLGSDGLPAMFVAQFAVPGDDRLAYLFVDPSWDPDLGGAEGILFAQPGTLEHASRPQATGPTYPSESTDFSRFVVRGGMRLTESSVKLVDGFDPPDWAAWSPGDDGSEDEGAWNKVGGTPRWLQGDETPNGDGWRFWFQYTAARIGLELADGAECYGFIDPDGRGTFIVQSH